MNSFSKMFCAVLLTFSAASLLAGPHRYLAIDNGYRWDRISNTVTLGGPTVSVKTSTQELKKINTYRVGVQGEWTFCRSFFINGSVHYGTLLGNGVYDEGGFSGKLKGNAYDAQAAVGYNYCLSRGVSIAPIVGYSYDKFDLKATDVEVTYHGHHHHKSDIKVNQRFSGPFVGFNLYMYPKSCIDLNFGYEFHWASWHGDRLIEGEEYGNPFYGSTTAYSNTRHVNRVLGNVFRLDGLYRFWGCWVAGLELKYQFFEGDYGHYNQTERDLLSQFTYANVDDLIWHSFASTIYVGREF